MFKEFKEFAMRGNVVIKALNTMKREEEAPAAEPTTKDCSFCATEIPIKATRCPHCTSELAGA